MKVVYLTLVFLFSFQATASVMSLNKTRIIFDIKDRRQDIRLFNTSDDFQTYRITVIDYEMNEQGELVPNQEFERSAKKFLRIGPRIGKNVAPKDSQLFRLMAKRKNMQDGEYRSFLLIEPLMPPLSEDVKGIVARPIFRYQIPVLIRNGNLTASIDIKNVKLIEPEQQNNQAGANQEESSPAVLFDIYRGGNRTIYGRAKIYHQTAGSSKVLLADKGILAIYPEIPFRTFSVPLSSLPVGGKITVEFSEDENFGGDLSTKANMEI